MKKIKLNKVKIGISLLGIIGLTALVAPMLVSCADGKPPVAPDTTTLTKKTIDKNFAKGGIWEGKTKLVAKDLEGYTEIGDGAFMLNQLITSIIIPNSVKRIGITSFAWSQLKSLTFEKGSRLEEIGFGAFGGDELTEVIIPKSVIFIGENAFRESWLKSLTFEKGSQLKKIIKGAFWENKLTEVVIPNGVELIGENAFASNKLKEVVIPKSVTTLSEKAFDEGVEIIR